MGEANKDYILKKGNYELAKNVRVGIFFFFFVFLGPHSQHMEFPRLGVDSKLQLLACATTTATQNGAASAIYTTVHSNMGSLTH